MTPSGPSPGEAAARDAAVVSVLTLLGRITGFVRIVVIAAVLGVTRFSDLYLSLSLLPAYVGELLLGSMVGSLLVPPLVRRLSDDNSRSMARLAGGLLAVLVGIAMVVTVLAIGAGSMLISLLALGAAGRAEQVELGRVGGLLLALLLPQLALYASAAVGAAAQVASGRQRLAAGAPILEHLIAIAVLGAWAGLFPGVESIAGVGTDQILFLGLGTTFAVALHAAMQWFGAVRCGAVILPRRWWRDSDVGPVVRLTIPAALYAIGDVARLAVFVVAAGLATGGQTVLIIALKLVRLPVGLTAAPLVGPAMPALARLRTDRASFAERYLRSLGVLLFVALPTTGLLVGLARPVALLSLWGDAATPRGVALLAAAIAGAALTIPGESVFAISTTAAYAKLDVALPLRAMALRVAAGSMLVAAVAAVLGSLPGPDWLLVAGIGVAMALGDALAAFVAAERVMAGLDGLRSGLRSHLPNGLVALAVSGLTALAVEASMGTSRSMAPAAILLAALVSIPATIIAETATHGNLRVDVVGLARRELAPLSALRPIPAELVAASRQRLVKRRSRTRPTMPKAPNWRPPSWRPSSGLIVILLGVVLLAVALGAGTLTADVGPAVPGGLAALVVFAAIVRRPIVGPLILLAVTPLVVGIVRGSFVPFLRVNEALLFAVTAAVGVHVLYRWSKGDAVRLAAGGRSSLDWAIGMLVLAATAVPLMIRFGRGLPISTEDLTHTFVFVKFGLLYVVFRFAVRTATDVRRCLIVALAAGVPVALLAVGQSMQVPGVNELLSHWYEGPAVGAIGRGPGTIGNSGALGDLMALLLAVALMLFYGHLDPTTTRDPRRRAVLGVFAVLAVVYAVGGLGSGQFSGFVATFIAVAVTAVAAGRPRALLALPAIGSITVAAVWPVVARRLEGFDNSANLPTSWQVRIQNIQELVWPTLRRDYNWAIGVRPDTSIDADFVANGEVFIESGFLWLLWAGGLVLLAAFVFFMALAFRIHRRAAKAEDPWLAACGGAGLAATTFVAVLTTIDPHFTLRGFADVFYPLLAMSLVAAAAPARQPARAGIAIATQPNLITGPPAIGWLRYSYASSAAKRGLDLLIGCGLLIVLAPLLAGLALAVRLTSPGPALFKQQRVGFAERSFTMLKFRTMLADNDPEIHRRYVQAMLREEAPTLRSEAANPTEFKLDKDDRITPLGRFLRRTSLDELPQLINVVRGDMSLVGPRPALAYEVSEYTPVHRFRAACVPGITGLWQVTGRNSLHMREALDLDVRYAQTCSLRTDLSILVRTVGVVARRSGV